MRTCYRPAPDDDIERLLTPGGAVEVFRFCRRPGADAGSVRSRVCYALVSFIKATIRERAADHIRSTERGDMPSTSADSAVVKPAK